MWFRCRQTHLCSKPGISLLNRENRANAQFKTLEARNTLKLWKKSYFDIRAKIEASGREARWEFDRKRLFERTDYMANICQDLADILQVGATSEMCMDLSGRRMHTGLWMRDAIIPLARSVQEKRNY